MSFDHDEPPTKKLGRAPSSGAHQETFALALRRIRERCQRVHELCMQTVEGEASTTPARGAAEGPMTRASHERSVEEQKDYLRALYARLHGHDDPHDDDETPPDRVRVAPAADDEEMRELWRQLFGGTGEHAPPARTPAARFELLRRALEEIIGAAATATLIRRAARRAAGRTPELRDLSIERRGVELRYTLPTSWTRECVDPLESLRDLVRELSPLLIELTGMVVIHRLGVVAERGTSSFPRAQRARPSPSPDAQEASLAVHQSRLD